MKDYYVESNSGWFVVRTTNKKRAKSVGVSIYGRGRVSGIRLATENETAYFITLKGKNAIYDNL